MSCDLRMTKTSLHVMFVLSMFSYKSVGFVEDWSVAAKNKNKTRYRVLSLCKGMHNVIGPKTVVP